MSEALQRKGLGDLTIEISDNVMTMNFPGRASYQYKFTLKPKERPKAIDFVTIETHGKAPQGTKVQGIYGIEDGKLKFCMPGGSSARLWSARQRGDTKSVGPGRAGDPSYRWAPLR